MKLKKISAALSLLSFAALILHMGYAAYAYLTLYYNPVLTKAIAIPLIVLTCLHAVAGMSSVFLLSDGTRADLYPKKNRRTIIQRITAAFIFPLLILHINTFSLMLIAAQILFYAVFITHAGVSFSKALITLGIIASAKAQRVTDKIIYALCGVLFAVTAFAVVKGQLIMFLPG